MGADPAESNSSTAGAGGEDRVKPEAAAMPRKVGDCVRGLGKSWGGCGPGCTQGVRCVGWVSAGADLCWCRVRGAEFRVAG